ncbi:MAG: type I restriction-modification system endonuclease [Polyangiaceae bacterium]
MTPAHPSAPRAPAPSPNFSFLSRHDPRLVALPTQAEALFAHDPAACLVRLRAFAEVVAALAAAKLGEYRGSQDKLADLVERLRSRNAISALQDTLFRNLRIAGNKAAHEGLGTHREALEQLRNAQKIGVWFERSFGHDRNFAPGPFIPPKEPPKADSALAAELDRLRKDLVLRAGEVESAKKAREAAEKAAEAAKKAAEIEAEARLSAEERAAKAQRDAEKAAEDAKKAAEEAALWEALAMESATSIEEAKRTAAENAQLKALSDKLAAELAAMQAAAEKTGKEAIEALVARAKAASDAIVLDEASTRRLIDQKLREAGWEADSDTLTYAAGARPEKGRNMAIAEWPTEHEGKKGIADYALFVGTMVVAVIEAKAKHKDIPGVLSQAKRYAKGFLEHGVCVLAGGAPWGEYKVPFLFATNGRPFLRQLKEKSGIWFLDARRAKNIAGPLPEFYTPEGLVQRLRLDIDRAESELSTLPMPYIDRDYQARAIFAVEQGLVEGRREMLVAMATGTGKTRMCIGLCYRLLKTKRFRRILFLVDRNALGKQTMDALADLRLENLQTFPEIYDVKGIGDLAPEPDTRLQIATVQAMVRRVLGETDDSTDPGVPVDLYDCIIVDECHRGYLLDREMSDREMTFRDEDDYISKYRRVLDHFDAVKIGLTATPALHTKEIFGAPIMTYSYREAVVDGYLVDHEPPIRIVTALAKDGIHYEAREEVLVLDRTTGDLRKEELLDDVDFEVDAFNRKVITRGFNEAVIGELVQHIDPEQDEKTLVFCVTDEHADMVVDVFKQAFTAKYGSVDDDAVVKITGSVDRPLELIRRYRNERLPSVAVTVDLLSTGIDIPKIGNLVFLRRVRSRVLYEQMLGRATRLCPEIKKERFRVFDAVDLYSAIKDVTDMKPVVVQPSVTFEELAREILHAPDQDHREKALEEMRAKLQRRKRGFVATVEDHYREAAGMTYEDTLTFLKVEPLADVAEWLSSHPGALALLDRGPTVIANKAVVSEHEDRVIDVSRGYGSARRPEDYIESFDAYIQGHLNELPALLVVTQRPRDLTRADLRALKLALDEKGFSEAALQTAWKDAKNEDIAATIIGHIRRLALGSPLMPYSERVTRAVQRIAKARKLTEPQRKWLDRIAEQLKIETVVDRAALDRGQFQAQGGFARLDRIFDGKLTELLGDLAEEVWRDAG